MARLVALPVPSPMARFPEILPMRDTFRNLLRSRVVPNPAIDGGIAPAARGSLPQAEEAR